MKILLSKVADVFRACLKDRPEVCAFGNSAPTAVTSLITQNVTDFADILEWDESFVTHKWARVLTRTLIERPFTHEEWKAISALIKSSHRRKETLYSRILQLLHTGKGVVKFKTYRWGNFQSNVNIWFKRNGLPYQVIWRKPKQGGYCLYLLAPPIDDHLLKKDEPQ